MIITDPVIPAPKTINLIVGMIREYMGLKTEQVTVYNQAWKIPSDPGLYISVGLLGMKPYSSQASFENTVPPEPAGLKEIISLNVQETYSINVMSRNQEAVERNNEVIMAFNSTCAQQICDANAIQLARLPLGMVDLSALEATAMLNRFNCTINLLCARQKSRIVQYYDTFPTPALVIEP